MIELHQFGPLWGINPSPFCLKVETYLRLSGLPFRAVTSMPNKAPRGKLPYIVDAGHTVPDSGAILTYLQGRYGDPFDQNLSMEQRATGHLVRRTCEESLFFIAAYSRWADPAGWAILRAVILPQLPAVLRPILPGVIRRSVIGRLKGQGVMGHTPDEIYAMGIADVQALAVHLGHKPFVLGESLSSFDAGFYGFMVNLLKTPFDNPLTAYAQGQENLSAYVARIDALLAACPAPAQ